MSDFTVGVAANERYAVISGIDQGEDTWARVSGPTLETTSEKRYNGGRPTPVRYRGRPTYGTMTLTRPFMFPRDADALLRIEQDIKSGSIQRTITVFTEQNDGVVRQESYIAFANSATPPDGDADGTGETMLTSVWEVLARA